MRRGIALCVWGIVSLAGSTAQAAELHVLLEGVDKAEGNLLLAVHRSRAGWEGGDDFHARDFHAEAWRIVPAGAAGQGVRFTDLPPGRYAVAAIHDVNADGRLNRHVYPWVGMPSEPYALSNAAWAMFGKADFDKAAFDLGEAGATLHLRLKTHMQRLKGE